MTTLFNQHLDVCVSFFNACKYHISLNTFDDWTDTLKKKELLSADMISYALLGASVGGQVDILNWLADFAATENITLSPKHVRLAFNASIAQRHTPLLGVLEERFSTIATELSEPQELGMFEGNFFLSNKSMWVSLDPQIQKFFTYVNQGKENILVCSAINENINAMAFITSHNHPIHRSIIEKSFLSSFKYQKRLSVNHFLDHPEFQVQVAQSDLIAKFLFSQKQKFEQNDWDRDNLAYCCLVIDLIDCLKNKINLQDAIHLPQGVSPYSKLHKI